MSDLELFEMVASCLEYADTGEYIENEETGVRVEVANMCGGRYLVTGKHGEPMRQTDNLATAYKYLNLR